MAYPDNLLVQGERVIVRKRPHWKVLIFPTLLFILIIGAGAALIAWLSSGDWEYRTIANYVIIGAAVIALIILVLVPFIRWRTEHFVITNHHVFFRTGLLSRREHQIPLGQIANMETEVTFWGRLMGYGSLIVESSADQPLKFRNVASLSKVQAQLNQLIRDERERTHRGPDDRDDAPSGGYRQGEPLHGGTQQGGTQLGGTQQGYPQPGYPQQGYSQGAPPQQGFPQQGYPQQGYDQQAYSQPGYQPTQAYQQPPGYPPPGSQHGYAAPIGQVPPTVASQSPSSTSAPAAPAGSAQGEGRPPLQP